MLKCMSSDDNNEIRELALNNISLNEWTFPEVMVRVRGIINLLLKNKFIKITLLK